MTDKAFDEFWESTEMPTVEFAILTDDDFEYFSNLELSGTDNSILFLDDGKTIRRIKPKTERARARR